MVWCGVVCHMYTSATNLKSSKFTTTKLLGSSEVKMSKFNFLQHFMVQINKYTISCHKHRQQSSINHCICKPCFLLTASKTRKILEPESWLSFKIKRPFLNLTVYLSGFIYFTKVLWCHCHLYFMDNIYQRNNFCFYKGAAFLGKRFIFRQ
jgi:hypothetical protein